MIQIITNSHISYETNSEFLTQNSQSAKTQHDFYIIFVLFIVTYPHPRKNIPYNKNQPFYKKNRGVHSVLLRRKIDGITE